MCLLICVCACNTVYVCVRLTTTLHASLSVSDENIASHFLTLVVQLRYFAIDTRESFEIVVVTHDHPSVGRHLRVHFEHLRPLRVGVPEGGQRGLDPLTGATWGRTYLPIKNAGSDGVISTLRKAVKHAHWVSK